MKIFKYLLACVVISNAGVVKAQDDYNYDESEAVNDGVHKLDVTSLDWDEYYDKEHSCGIMGTALHLESKKKDAFAMAVANFPIDVKKDFTITAKLKVSSINSESSFGLILNYKDDENYDLGLFKENEFKFVRVEGGEWVDASEKKSKGKKGKAKSNEVKLKLKKAKNAVVEVKLQQKGSKMLFSINGDENFYSRRNLDLEKSDFGFYTDKKSWLNVEMIEITQYEEHDD
ncbi:MAG: hypothetical protein K2M94_02250 [Paramuribaculum sp.]|nr:hypothetical protein [Paramuribaculum sp.]